MEPEIEAVTGGKSHYKGKGISKETSSARFSQQSSLAITGSRGQGCFHKNVESIVSRLGRPVVGDALTGRVDNPSLVFGDFEFPKSIIVSVFIERYIDLRKGT